MAEKVIPHVANSIQKSFTNKPGDSDYLAMSQRGITEHMIEDAPKDGKKYVRQDGKWVELPESSAVYGDRTLG